MVRKKYRHATLYPKQVIQLRYLVSLAAAECRVFKGQKVAQRYTILVICNSNSCAPESGKTREVELQGAVRGIDWLMQHHRHNTYVKGKLHESPA